MRLQSIACDSVARRRLLPDAGGNALDWRHRDTHL